MNSFCQRKLQNATSYGETLHWTQTQKGFHKESLTNKWNISHILMISPSSFICDPRVVCRLNKSYEMRSCQIEHKPNLCGLQMLRSSLQKFVSCPKTLDLTCCHHLFRWHRDQNFFSSTSSRFSCLFSVEIEGRSVCEFKCELWQIKRETPASTGQIQDKHLRVF